MITRENQTRRITRQEIEYLCGAVSAYLRRPVAPSEVVWAYSGVRPLYDRGAAKPQEVSRDYVLKLEAPEGGAPLLEVFGGKITTYRKLAEDGLEMLASHLPGLRGAWTAGSRLPGDMSWDDIEKLVRRLMREFPFLREGHVRRLARTYGTRAHRVLGDARSADDLGQQFGWDLAEREVRYLMKEEWARTAEDILWRRTKLGLRVSAAELHTSRLGWPAPGRTC